MNDVSRIEIVPIREAFPHEAHNFTVWLENNIEALSDRLGFPLNVLEREKSVGSFNVDLFCEDIYGEYVIIENQLERTDHSHLGQLMTYLVNLDAKTAIWVATEIRSEHQRVIDWLNEMTSEDFAFFAVQVEAIRIGDSPYAPLFTVLAQPDEQTRLIGKAKKEQASSDAILMAFWTNLLRLSEGRFEDFQHLTPGERYYLSMTAGVSGVSLSYNIMRDGYGMQIYIDTRDKERNKHIFDWLFAYKEDIEAAIGLPLDWRRLDDKQASRIKLLVEPPDDFVWANPDTWDELQLRMIEVMSRFSHVFKKYLQSL